MNPRLARHYAPCRAVVLGARLQKFSLWHLRTLAALESAVVDPVKEVTFSDLAPAVSICCCAPNTPLEKAVRVPRIWLALAAIVFRWRIEDEISEFFEYIAYYSAGPRSRGKSSRDSGFLIDTPVPLYLHTALMARGYDNDAAWACTPGLARWELASFDELRGRKIKIWTPRHVATAKRAGIWTDGDDY